MKLFNRLSGDRPAPKEPESDTAERERVRRSASEWNTYYRDVMCYLVDYEMSDSDLAKVSGRAARLADESLRQYEERWQGVDR